MRKLQTVIFVLALIVFLGSAGYLGKYFYDRHVSSKNMDDIKSMLVEDSASEEPGESLPSNTGDDVLLRYSQLYEQNHDLAGWITIEGTNIDYPVMYVQGDNDMYLHRNFKKEYDAGGVPFIDGNCTLNPRDNNLVIYGHSMNDKSMFQNLLNYREESYYKKHPIVRFDTLKEQARYQIVAVIMTEAKSPEDPGFHYDTSYRFDDESAFNDYWQNISSLSLYETGCSPVYEDELITLSTCEYSSEDGRLAVIAKKIKNE